MLINREVSQQEVATLIKKEGGSIDSWETFRGTIQQGDDAIWVAIDILEWPEVWPTMREEQPEVFAEIMTKLGNEPKMSLVITIHLTSGSQHLAVDFVARCVKQWPCIVNTLGNGVYSKKEVLDL